MAKLKRNDPCSCGATVVLNRDVLDPNKMPKGTFLDKEGNLLRYKKQKECCGMKRTSEGYVPSPTYPVFAAKKRGEGMWHKIREVRAKTKQMKEELAKENH